MSKKKPSQPADSDALLETLEARFADNMHRHETLTWDDVRSRLDGAPEALSTLHAMEESGGEPDVVGRDDETGAVLFVDCSTQSPKGRRSVCYDEEARVGRKKYPPESSAMEMANAMGAELAGLSLVSNLAAGLGETALSHDEVVAAGAEAADRLEAIVTEFCRLQ